MKSTCYLCDKQVETEELEVGQYPICDECVKRMENEDKLDPTANTEAELMEVVRNYGIDIENLEKKLATAVEALEDINNGTWHSKNRGLVVDTSDKGTISLFDFTEKVLAEIGGEDE